MLCWGPVHPACAMWKPTVLRAVSVGWDEVILSAHCIRGSSDPAPNSVGGILACKKILKYIS